MAEEMIIEEKLLSETNLLKEARFKGYTISQLRYRRAMIAVKKEYALQELISEKRKFTNPGNFGKFGSVARTVSNSVPLIGRIFRGLSYMDYITMGLSLYGGVRKIFHLFRKKK